jgi:hypothetical protein
MGMKKAFGGLALKNLVLEIFSSKVENSRK